MRSVNHSVGALRWAVEVGEMEIVVDCPWGDLLGYLQKVTMYREVTRRGVIICFVSEKG